MSLINADFNARIESGHISLTTIGSLEDREKLGVYVGDRVWLSDSELIVGALVSIDPYYGVVGIADFDTLVHLDDEEG